MFYPDDFNAAYAACPDPIDFRAYTVVDLYDDTNAYFAEGPFAKVPRPGHRNYLGHVSATLEQMNRAELVLGTKSRSGQQWDIWEAVYSPQGPDGYPARIWDKRTGVIDTKVAEYWKEHFDLGWILRRDWNRGLGKKLGGKIHLYGGDMDNYYLNNAVYLVEDFLKTRIRLRRRSDVWRPRRALLERRPDARQRVFTPALSPDVHPALRRARAQDRAARGGCEVVGVLSNAEC